MDNCKKYLKDVLCFESFINDFNIIENNSNIKYDNLQFWRLVFLLSRSYINDNFHKMLELVNQDYLELIFSGNVKIDDFKDTTFPTNNEEILKLLIDNHYFKISTNTKDYIYFFKIIRNHLSHYNYELNNNIIIINYDKKSISLSIATLVLIVLATLSNVGQSKKIYSYDFSLSLLGNYLFETKVINLIDNNNITPLDFISYSVPVIINNLLLILNNYDENAENTPKDELEIIKIEKIREAFPEVCKSFGYEAKLSIPDDIITTKVENYLQDNGYEMNEDIKLYSNLYSMLKDDIKLATISYKLFIGILFSIFQGNRISSPYKVFFPILKNLITINYLNIVFCDYATNNNKNISNELFDYINPEDEKNIPHKMRNSLAHCHYKFQDITKNTSDIIIEFWDEQKGIINFKCKIKKENVYKLINNYTQFFKNI